MGNGLLYHNTRSGRTRFQLLVYVLFFVVCFFSIYTYRQLLDMNERNAALWQQLVAYSKELNYSRNETDMCFEQAKRAYTEDSEKLSQLEVNLRARDDQITKLKQQLDRSRDTERYEKNCFVA